MYDEVSILDYVQAAESRERSNQPTSLELPNSERSTSSKPKKSAFWIYYVYFSHGAGILLFSVFLSSNIITQGLFTGIDYWLAEWTDYQENLHIQEQERNNNTIKRNPLIAKEMHSNIIIYR